MHRIPLQWAISLLVLTPIAAESQGVFPEFNGEALTGVQSVDARVLVYTWLSVEGSRDNFSSNAQTAFELGLRRDGIVVDPGAPNYLFCELMVAQRSGVVAYSWHVTYYSYELADVHVLRWRTGGIVTVGPTNFDAEEAAGDCVDGFANEWLKQNPRPPGA